jgi:hypothetical protein
LDLEEPPWSAWKTAGGERDSRANSYIFVNRGSPVQVWSSAPASSIIYRLIL